MLKSTQLTLVAVFGLAIAACHHTKKSSAATAPTASSQPLSTNSSATVTSTNDSPMLMNPSATNYVPGNNELTALQVYYKDATMQQLNDGHAIYTAGMCIKCHEPVDIYKISASNWKSILPDMARRANLSETNIDAVNKYFIAIKAMQPK